MKLIATRIRLTALLPLLAMLALTTGCEVFGLVASKMPPPTVAPAYTGLAGQNVAVMVWAQPGAQIDWPKLRLDVAGGVIAKLRQAQDPKSNIKTLEGTQFVRADSVVRFQEEHPEIEGEPIADVAPRLGGATRVIYIELEEFETRADASVELYRGQATASVKVVEVEGGQARVAYEEPSLRVTFPRNVPEEGITNTDDYTMYRGTLDAFTTEVAKLFIPHSDEP